MSAAPAAAAHTVLVTGASSGIGREIARVAVETCDTVVLVARRRERLEELAAELGDLRPGVRALPWPADLADAGRRRTLPGELEAAGVTVDWLVNNAGFGVAGPFHEIDADRLQAMVEVDVAALHHLCRLFLPGMVARRRGGVLNVASTAAHQPLPWMATYGAGKAFVLSLSEALWQELRGTGVTVTCLCPGRTRTEFFDEADMEGIPFMKVPPADPAAVARAGWQGMLDGKRVVVPGFQNQLNAAFAPRLPRRPILAVAGKLFRR